MSTKPTIGFVLYDGFTALDVFGPYEVLAAIGSVLLIARTSSPVRSEHGFRVIPDVDFTDCPDLDVFVLPGGPGCDRARVDLLMTEWITERVRATPIVATVCTGALILASCHDVTGLRLATHWLALSELSRCGAAAVHDRFVVDGKFWSSAGVSAGIDMALNLVARLSGDTAARRVCLDLQYDPQAPYPDGDPARADSRLVATARALSRYA